jgi:hypothetical protein
VSRSVEEAIRQVLYRYCAGVDRGDEALLRSAFHDDAVDDHGSFRLPASEAVPRILEATRRSRRSQHHLTNVLIELGAGGDEAAVESYALCQLVDAVEGGGERIRMLGLRYVDRVTERGGEWRIAERTVVHDWSLVLPMAETWDRAPLLPAGTRDADDPRYRVFTR